MRVYTFIGGGDINEENLYNQLIWFRQELNNIS